MGKPTICMDENKGADQLISAFVFATRIVQFCGGSFCFMSWCLKYFCAVGALCMFSYF